MDLNGSMCAIATPWHAAGELDLEALDRLVDYQIEGGTQVLVVAGSTGEAHFLSDAEYSRLLERVVAHVDGRVPVVAGTGEAGTLQTVARTRHAAAVGADAALVVAPFYVRPSQEGLRQHFLQIADDGGLPVIAYNVPSRTACDMLPETVEQLREHPRILGIKEAVGEPERIRRLAELAASDFVYLSGDDYTAGEAMLAGAHGTVSVVANLVPGVFRQLCDAARLGESAVVATHVEALSPLLEAMRCAPNPTPVKAGLAMLGIGDGSVRAPLLALALGTVERTRLHQALAGLVPDLPGA